MISRRNVVLSAVSLPVLTSGLPAVENTSALTTLYFDPLLKDILSRQPRRDCNAEGACGPNRGGFERIEYQRDGTEAIIGGLVTRNADWLVAGWKMLDWGQSHLTEERFTLSRGDWFHVTSLFVEALARALIVDPKAATASRLHSLQAGANLLLKYEQDGMRANAPLTHRFFILFAALGQSHTLLGDQRYGLSAWRWAERGLALQAADGVNPELGGFDASYQIVGPLFAMRYYPNCNEKYKRARISEMVRKALNRWLNNVDVKGNVETSGSTRIGKEFYSGRIKHINYYETFQALVFAGRLFSDNKYLQAASLIRPTAFKALGIRA